MPPPNNGGVWSDFYFGDLLGFKFNTKFDEFLT